MLPGSVPLYEPSIEDILAARDRRRRLDTKYTQNQLVAACIITGLAVLAVCMWAWR